MISLIALFISFFPIEAVSVRAFMIALLKLVSDVSFKLVSWCGHSSFIIWFAVACADTTVRFSVFLDLSGFGFFTNFQACLLDWVKSMFSIVSLDLFCLFS